MRSALYGLVGECISCRYLREYKDKKILAVITAGGGAKGLPGKNIRLMNGRTLIVWTLKSGRESRYMDGIVVSTDSQDIADAYIANGVDVLVLRPAYLAEDVLPLWMF